ncbi:uncharacterized protein OCT59_016392 [Rhizophagus irregularis]|uniref:uncharacterized protein n=1 Tax=Rhizophagus irregularis TaxID=588596 RepID=UPI00332D55A2|nr:hypothetical protein OCT59_016392 [Rhizophagus irregularis]
MSETRQATDKPNSSAEAVLETNPRGIPKVQFVENVEEFISKSSAPVEVTLGKFQETVAKYKFMEINFLNRKKGLELKIPEISKTLTVVEYLVSKQANVMLEYTLQEAKELLENKLDTNQNALKNVLEDLEFLREQVTTMEILHVYTIGMLREDEH